VLEVDTCSKYNTVFVDFRYLLAIYAFVYHSSAVPRLSYMTLNTTYTYSTALQQSLLRSLPYSTALRQGSFVACLQLLQPIRHLTPLLPRFHLTKHNNPPSPSCNNRIPQPNSSTKSSNSTSIPTQQCTQSRKPYHQS
jgi:hypothetical protein